MDKIINKQYLNDINILAIETSCDETAASVVRNGKNVLSNVIYSQIEIHKQYGGVMPEIASRNHVLKINEVVKCAIDEANCDLHAVAVTNGPGLVGALLVGVSFAKAYAFAKQLPLIAVNHIKSHIFANFISNLELEPPFLCLVVSGGHSHIIEVLNYDEIKLVGRTRDDAAGEAFDKGARTLSLSYPGGVKLEQLAKNGDDNAYIFKSAFNDEEHFDFSFSGYKTALINIIHNAEQKNETIDRASLAASYQKAINKTLTNKLIRAAKQLNYKKIAIAGGVSANLNLRESIKRQATENNIEFYCPKINLCTDNAAMVGCAAYFQYIKNDFSQLSLNANPARAFKN